MLPREGGDASLECVAWPFSHDQLVRRRSRRTLVLVDAAWRTLMLRGAAELVGTLAVAAPPIYRPYIVSALHVLGCPAIHGPRVGLRASTAVCVYADGTYIVYLSAQHTRIKPSVKRPKSGILVTEVITFDKIAPWVILGRS